jgi:hypothetical protein
MIKKATLYFLILSVLGCGFSTEKRRPKAIEETLSDRSVKKISEAEILNNVQEAGDSITRIMQGVFIKKVSEKYAKGGFEQAAAFCSLQAYPLTDSLAEEYNVFVKRVSTKYRNPQNAPSDVEKGLLEAYGYSHEQGQELQSNVQFLRPGDTVLYNKPIFIASALCLNCHGSKSEIPQEVQKLLAEKYPNDKAIGYEKGDLRGMWSLKFLKSEVVKSL